MLSMLPFLWIRRRMHCNLESSPETGTMFKPETLNPKGLGFRV